MAEEKKEATVPVEEVQEQVEKDELDIVELKADIKAIMNSMIDVAKAVKDIKESNDKILKWTRAGRF